MKRIKNTQVAEYMGVTASSVSHWFRGDNFLDIDNLYKLCKYLGVSLDQIFGLVPIVVGVLNEDENNILSAYRLAGSETKTAIRKILSVPDPKKDSEQSAI